MIKEIQLRRREVKSHLPPPVVANSKRTLSSIYDGQGPLRGVEDEEEVKLLCEYLGLKKNDPSLSKELRNWWADLRVEVPSDGVVLNISVDNDGNPVNIKDYLVYKWALRHKYVGKDRDDMLSSSHKVFYIYDPDVELKQQSQALKIKKKAYQEFIMISEDEDKLDLILRVLTDNNPDEMSMPQKQNYVDQLIEGDPAKFVSVATDKHIEIKALIADLVSHNVLTKLGNQYWWIDEKLGDDIEETVLYFKDKKNSADVNKFKAKLQQAKKTT